MRQINFLKSVKTWPELEKKLLHTDNRTKGQVFEYLTKKFLQFDPKYAGTLKQVWLFREIPPTILKKLHLPATDQGIDIVCETYDGGYWSVQCKFISDSDRKITHRQISTFMSLTFGLSKKFSYGLICTTVDDYAKIYRNKANVGFVLSDTWLALGRDFFAFVRADGKRPQKLITKLTPLQHQKRAIAAATKYFVKEKNSRGKLVFPCGAGKSLTGYWIAESLKARSVIVAVPSLALVKQTLEVYLGQNMANKRDVRWLCVCSDESIGKNDDIAIHTQDIGIPCVTDIATISNWLKKHKHNHTIIFTTYQSARSLGKAAKRVSMSFDLGILDEAHKTVGASDKLFSLLLSEKHVKIKRRIFMTATERRYRGSADDIVSMDDPALFGETFEHMSFRHAVESKILSDYKIITLFVSNEEVKSAISKNGLSQDGLDARSLAALIAMRKAIDRYPIRHAVSFHSSIKKAQDFQLQQDQFTQKNKKFSAIETFHVSGAMPTATRSKFVQEFAKSPKSLITNAKCLTEGVDVPGIDAVLFADPRKSTVDIVQAVGRALRKSPGKKYGYVILPVFTENLNDTEVLESEDFKEIIQTLRALASNDERIIEYFRDTAKGEQPKGDLIHFDIDINGVSQINERKLIKEIELRTWNRLAKLNWRPFEEAREYVRGLGLKGESDWRNYCKNNKLPPDISTAPHHAYRNKGWLNWGDWLGTGIVATYFKVYREFHDARNFVHTLNIANSAEWSDYCKSGKKPEDIPATPGRVYQDKGWLGFGDWLGTHTIANSRKNFANFVAARKFAHSLNLKSESEWKQFAMSGKKPANIPASPQRTYSEKGWVSWGDWLGTKIVATHLRQYRPFDEARLYAHSLNLKSGKDWAHFAKSGLKPDDIPADPRQTYLNNGWQGMGNWLGTGVVACKDRKFARSLKLKNETEWRELCRSGKKPFDIPANPDRTYAKQGFAGFADWLGYESKRHARVNYWPFIEARNYVQHLRLRNQSEWFAYCKSGKKPMEIPYAPGKAYKNDGWRGFGDWLGTGRPAPNEISFRDFSAAREFVHDLKLRSEAEWRAYCKSGAKPSDIPAGPARVYANAGWQSMGDWLGTGTTASRYLIYRKFKHAREFAQSLKIASVKQWRQFCKTGQKPADIPANPEQTYQHKGWQGYGDWLGTGVVSSRLRNYRPFKAARKFARSLNLSSRKEWQAFCRSGAKPVDIPKIPDHVYAMKGWRSWSDFLGS